MVRILVVPLQTAAISIRVLYRDIVLNTIVYLPAYCGAVSRGLASWGPRIEGRGE